MSTRGKTSTRRRPTVAGRPPPRVAAVQVRPVRGADLPEVIGLDATVTGLHKADYWQRVYRRYGIGGQGLRHFLVAVDGTRVVGFVIGEVRDWEFGSPPCGWVFAIDVDPRARQKGVGTLLLAAIRERFEPMRASTSRRFGEAWWEQRGELDPYPVPRCKPRSSARGCGTT